MRVEGTVGQFAAGVGGARREGLGRGHSSFVGRWLGCLPVPVLQVSWVWEIGRRTGYARRSRVAIASICDCECGGRRVAFGRVAAVGRNRVRKLLLCLGSRETKVETRGWRILDATRSFGPEQLLKNVAARRKIKSKFAFMY